MINLHEIKETGNLLQNEEEIKTMIDFYKKSIGLLGQESDSIETKLKNPYKIRKFVVFGIPLLTIREIMNDDEQIRLKQRLHDIPVELKEKSEYYKMWLKRHTDYENRKDETIKEMNINFDWIEADAKKYSKYNIYLRTHMTNYDKKKDSERSVQFKMEYYLFLKFEVAKHYKKDRKHFILKSE